MSEQIATGQTAPDFELTNVEGNTVCLSDYRNKKHAILVFTRGFM